MKRKDLKELGLSKYDIEALKELDNMWAQYSERLSETASLAGDVLSIVKLNNEKVKSLVSRYGVKKTSELIRKTRLDVRRTVNHYKQYQSGIETRDESTINLNSFPKITVEEANDTQSGSENVEIGNVQLDWAPPDFTGLSRHDAVKLAKDWLSEHGASAWGNYVLESLQAQIDELIEDHTKPDPFVDSEDE